MSIPLVLGDDWPLGMKQDLARNQMPKGVAWNLVDYVPRILGAPLRKRGSWTWGSPLSGTGSYTVNVFFAPFRAGPKLIKVDNLGNWYDVVSDTSETAISGSFASPNPYWFHRDKIFAGYYANAPVYWTGSGGLAAVAAAPQAAYGITYKDRSVMANGKVGATDLPQRVWLSAPGDPLTWDLTNTFIDASFPVRGLASLRNMFLIFGDRSTERVVGAEPPSSLSIGDMERGVAFNVGCLDARSITSYGEMVLFANGEGVWRTDGSVPENLVRAGGLRTYWRNLLSQWRTGWTLAGGIYGDSYVISISDDNRVFQDCLILDLGTLSWSRLANVNAAMMTSAQGAAEEVYFGLRDRVRLGRLAPIFRPSASLGADANGVVVQPIIETGYVEGKPGIKRWLDLFCNYLLDGSGVGTSPTFQVGVITEPEDTTYTTIGSLPGEAIMRRDTLPIRFDSPGIALKFQQQLASSDTRMFSMEASVNPFEGSRVR